jgi:DNA-binding GntR family transcriptional regulator
MIEAAGRNDFRLYLKHHLRYHEIFIQASRNETLIGILENLRRQALWFRFSYLYHQENYEYALRVHREDRLEKLVKDHILIALERFLKFLATRDGETREQ